MLKWTVFSLQIWINYLFIKSGNGRFRFYCNSIHTRYSYTMRKILALSILLLTLFFVKAEEPVASMNLFLYNKMTKSQNQTEKVTVMVKGNLPMIESIVTQEGGRVISAMKDLASISISLHGLAVLSQSSAITRIEAYPRQYKVMNDTMRMLSRVNEANQGIAPLTQGYDGTGVVLGFIDSGIDFRHPDFKDSLGHSRIQWLWDQNLPNDTNTPQPYAYGQEFSAQDIDDSLAEAHTGAAEYGHGTYVAGIGAGNGLAVGHFQGVAPKSDIIAVSFNFSIDAIPHLSHAIEYIFTKAQQLGKPCVINVSLGDYFGSHDGTDLESEYISNLINQQSGRVVVASAGNIGVAYPIHLGRTSVSGDTAFTWFRYDAGFSGAYIQLFADSAQFTSMRYSVGADKVTPYYEYRGGTSFTSATAALNTVLTRNLTNAGNRLGVIQTYLTKYNGVYSLEIYVHPDSVDYNWRITTTGNGHFDSWSYDWGFQNLPTAVDYPPMSAYILPDTMQSIITGIGCLDNVIVVGNYFNTDRHVDVNGTLQITPTDLPRDLAINSSRGPTRDGRIKPDICAPGHHILSCGVLSLIPGMISTQPYKVALGGYHITGGGTSASAPVVAGIAALYLQLNPSADWSDVKTAITGCAAHDQFTWGPFPNNAWGYGKADAFATLTNCGPVNVNSLQAQTFDSYPNPSNGKLEINLGDFNGEKGELYLYDLSGKVLLKVPVMSKRMHLDLSDLNNGLYFLSWKNTDQLLSIQKIIVSH